MITTSWNFEPFTDYLPSVSPELLGVAKRVLKKAENKEHFYQLFRSECLRLNLTFTDNPRKWIDDAYGKASAAAMFPAYGRDQSGQNIFLTSSERDALLTFISYPNTQIHIRGRNEASARAIKALRPESILFVGLGFPQLIYRCLEIGVELPKRLVAIDTNPKVEEYLQNLQRDTGVAVELKVGNAFSEDFSFLKEMGAFDYISFDGVLPYLPPKRLPAFFQMYNDILNPGQSVGGDLIGGWKAIMGFKALARIFDWKQSNVPIQLRLTPGKTIKQVRQAIRGTSLSCSYINPLNAGVGYSFVLTKK